MSPYLERYQAILDGQAHARFHLTRSVEAELAEDLPLTDLWKVHQGKLSEYRKLIEAGAHPNHATVSLLDLKRRIARSLLTTCCLCEHDCGTDRTMGRQGRCGVLQPMVASHFIHMGEEEPLVPSYTIFFAGCTMECVFCQNYDISTHPEHGRCVPPKAMAESIDRASAGSSGGRNDVAHLKAKNANWVGGDPTPDLPFVLDVLGHVESNIAQVWNSNMYMSEKAMVLLDGVIDVYLTDLKFGNDPCALRLSGTKDYMRVVTRNHLLAASQCEVIVRHLMLPGHLQCCTIPVVDWLAEHMPTAMVNIMAQYRPEHKALEHPELRARVTRKDLLLAIDHARRKGLHLI